MIKFVISAIARSLRSGAWIALAALLPIGGGYAQTGPAGSGDVMQLFRSMGSGQQQQILQQLGVGSGGLGTSTTGTTSTTTLNGAQEGREQDLEAEALRREREQQQKLEERLQILRADDWIVVEVDTTPLPPRPADTTEALYEALTAGTGMASTVLAQQLTGTGATQSFSQINTSASPAARKFLTVLREESSASSMFKITLE